MHQHLPLSASFLWTDTMCPAASQACHLGSWTRWTALGKCEPRETLPQLLLSVFCHSNKTSNTHMLTHTCMHTCILHIHIHTHIGYMHTNSQVCTHRHTQIDTQNNDPHMRECVHIHRHTRSRIHTYIHIYTHMHIK